MRGLLFDFNYLGFQGKSIISQCIHFRISVANPHVLQRSRQSGRANAQHVDFLRHVSAEHAHQAGCGSAGHDFQLPADGFLHPNRQGHYRTVAAQIGSDSRQMEVGQFPFHGFCGFHQLIVVEVAFPQVAQVRHQHHVMHHAVGFCRLVQRPQSNQFTVQAVVRHLHQLIQLRKHRHPNHQQGNADVSLAAALQLLHAGGGNHLCAAGHVIFRHRQNAVGPFDDAGHKDPGILAPIANCFYIMSQALVVDHNRGISSLCHPRTSYAHLLSSSRRRILCVVVLLNSRSRMITWVIFLNSGNFSLALSTSRLINSVTCSLE